MAAAWVIAHLSIPESAITNCRPRTLEISVRSEVVSRGASFAVPRRRRGSRVSAIGDVAVDTMVVFRAPCS